MFLDGSRLRFCSPRCQTALLITAKIMAGKVQRKVHVQLSLDSARRPDGKHGGWRPKAGRKKKRGSISHDTRPEFAARYPQHVTLRIVDGGRTSPPTGSRRRSGKRSAIRTSRTSGSSSSTSSATICTSWSRPRESARCTSACRASRSAIAKRLNAALKRTGKLFAHRYHARVLTSPTQVRNTLRYVLLNRRHHAAERYAAKNWIDPWSSAAWFDGWARPIVVRYVVEAGARRDRGADAASDDVAAEYRLEAPGLLDFDDRPA